MQKQKYLKREAQFILAVQLNLDTDGFNYHKWGNVQRCSAGDWIVNNDGECYTITDDSFQKTYTEVAPAKYKKTAHIWAEQMQSAGEVKTNEGITAYAAGDYLVSNEADGSDAYAISQSRFEQMYKLCD